jgi:hypothetical protein
MKRLFFLIIVCLFMVSCGKQADGTVEKFIDNIKNKKIDAAMKFVKDENVAKNVEIMEISYKNKTQEAIFEALFKNMNYKILQTKKESDEKTIVKVEIENVDVKGVFSRLFEETMNDIGVSDGTSKADDHSSLEKKLIAILNDKNVPKIKATTEFTVYKTKDGNKIELTPDNVNVMFGQIYTSIERFEKSGESSEEKKTEPEDIQPKPQPMQKK